MQAQFLIPTVVSLGVGILFGTGILMMIVSSLATLQREAQAWVKTTLLGYEEPKIGTGPYGKGMQTVET